jgi:hypothetical protein
MDFVQNLEMYQTHFSESERENYTVVDQDDKNYFCIITNNYDKAKRWRTDLIDKEEAKTMFFRPAKDLPVRDVVYFGG